MHALDAGSRRGCLTNCSWQRLNTTHNSALSNDGYVRAAIEGSHVVSGTEETACLHTYALTA